MRRSSIGMALILLTATARAEDAADRPTLILNTGGHTAEIVKILFTLDGKQVVTVSKDRTARLWDRATGQSLAVFRLPVVGEAGGYPRAGALYCSPDGGTKTLAVAGYGYPVGEGFVRHVFLIDLASGSVVATLPGFEKAIASLAFSHDGKLLAGGDLSGKAYLWDMTTHRLTHTLEGHKGAILDVAFSPDDKLLATACNGDSTARLWSVETGQEACPPLKHEGGVYCVAWRDNHALLTGGAGNVHIHEWDRGGKPLKHFFDKVHSPLETILTLSVIPDKDRILYTIQTKEDEGKTKGLRPMGLHGGGYLFDLKSEKVLGGEPVTSFAGGVVGAVSPDGLMAAISGDDDHGVQLWNTSDGKDVGWLGGRGDAPFHAGWWSDGAVVGWSYVMAQHDQHKEGWAKGPVQSITIGPMIVDDAHPQRSFDLAELCFVKKRDGEYVRGARSLDGLRLEEPDPRTLEVRRDKDLVAAVKLEAAPRSFCLLPGERVAVGYEGRIVVYSARTGQELTRLKNPAGVVWDLAPSPDGRYLLASSSDKRLRVYDPDKPEPLLSLFTAGADWVAWTQEGYYAASPAGEKLMGWQVNHGLDQLGAFHPAAEFHKTFYRPDIIKRVLAEGSVEKARAAADKANGTTTQAVEVAQALPPEVSILSPAPGKLDKAEVEVKAQAVSKDRPVVSLRLLLDGRPCPGAEAKTFPGAKPGDKQEASWTVTLPEGEHTLNARAESDVSAAASSEVAVAWQPAAQEPLPTLYVLTVGINAYPGSLKLNWALDDAAAVAKAFQAEAAPKPFSKVEVKTLLDKDANKEGILAGLGWLKQKMTEDDTTIVFYAGHGHRDKKSGQFYLLPQDVDVGDLDKTGVTGTQLKDKLKAVPGRVLVLLDACHSGSIGQAPLDPTTDDVQRQLAAPDCGVVVMCAAMAQEEAGEAAAVQHGFFTAALLKGLGGEAPPSKDGLIHLTALNFYVEEEVAELSKDEQHVVVDRPSTVTSFPLVQPPKKPEER